MSGPFNATVPHAVEDCRGCGRAAKNLFYALSRHTTRKRGFCYPSQATLAAALGCCERQIRRMMEQLFACGHVELRRRGSTGQANVYWLHFEAPAQRKLPNLTSADWETILAKCDQRTKIGWRRRLRAIHIDKLASHVADQALAPGVNEAQTTDGNSRVGATHVADEREAVQRGARFRDFVKRKVERGEVLAIETLLKEHVDELARAADPAARLTELWVQTHGPTLDGS